MKFLFSNEVSTEALTAGVAVSKVRDHFGEPVNSTRAVSVALIPDETAVLLNSTASWDKGSVYAVRYSSTLADINGIALGAESTHYFTVKMDYLASNVAVPMNGSGPSVTVPPGAYSSDYYVVVTTAQTSLAVEAANRKLSAMPGAAASVLSVLNVLVYDASGNAVQPSSSCVLTFLYADADGDGIVDGSFPPVRVKDLTVWRLDETNYLWVRQAGADINALAMEASLEVPHLSSYALMAVPDTNVSSVYAYPVPFSPNAGNTARYGDWTGLITFTNLPAFGKIRIYTITGDRVRELDVVPPSMKWDVRNSGGEIVASGVYVWEIVSGTNRKTGKLMVVK
ncbi:MAG: hypothetical protein NTY45_09935 [Elusimicrobia bacterium]|nr:hypothetical protein [Elusimicrobiota bacterium]